MAARPTRVRRGAGWPLVVAGGLAVIGSVLPWSVVTTFKHVVSFQGLRHDGWFTLVLGIALVLIGIAVLQGYSNQTVAVVALCVAAAIAVIAVYSTTDLAAFGNARDTNESLEVGHGLVITMIGGLLGVIGSARLVALASRAAPAVGRRGPAGGTGVTAPSADASKPADQRGCTQRRRVRARGGR